MATSLDALEALLQFRESASDSTFKHVPRSIYLPGPPVPNPLDPTQPHLIEGDAQITVVNRRLASGSDVRSSSSHKPIVSPDATKVPDPLATPTPKNKPPRHPPSSCSSIKKSTTAASQNWIVDHCLARAINNDTSTPRPVASDSAFDVDVRTDKIRDALNSKPQRGKKRGDLNRLERQELMRTRNREHAKSTRIKKKARFDDLIEIEKKYMLVKEIELLHVRRRLRLIDFVEQRAEKRCINSSRLYELASQEILNPEFSVTDAVVLTSDNSCTVRVLAHGSSLDLANPKTLSGMICVDFAPGSTDIRDISLYWCTTSSVSTSFPPSVSLSNLEW